METEKLIKMLSVIGKVTRSSWSTVMDIVECINNEESNVIAQEKAWHKGHYNEGKALNLASIDTWSTHDGECIDLRFSIIRSSLGDILVCDVVIWDGDSFGGHRIGKRFTAKLLLPISFIYKIEDEIHYAFKSYLVDEYNKHLELQKERWMKRLKTKLIN